MLRFEIRIEEDLVTNSVIGSLRVNLSANSAELNAGLREAVSAMQAFGQKAASEAQSFAKAFAAAGEDGGEQLSEKLAAATEAVKTTVLGKLGQIVGAMPGLWGKIAAFGVSALGGVWDRFEPIIAAKLAGTIFDSGLWDRLSGVVGQVAGHLGVVFDMAVGRMGEWVSGIMRAWQESGTIFEGIQNALYATFIAPWEGAFAAMRDWVSGIGDAWNSSTGALDGIKNALHAAFVEPIKAAWEALRSWAAAIQEAWQKSDGTLSGLANALRAALSHPFRDGDAALADSSAAFSTWSKAASEAMQSAGKSVQDFLKQRAGIAAPEEGGGEWKTNTTGGGGDTWLDEMMRRGQRVFERTRTDAERVGLEIGKLNELLQAGAIDWDTYQRAVEQVQDRFSGVAGVMRSVESSMANAFTDAITGAKKLGDAMQDLLRNVGRMFAREAVTQALGSIFGPGGLNIPGFSSGGLKFAHGGAFTVPGAGGTDSQLVAFRATPGERVSVDRSPRAGDRQPQVTVNNYTDASVTSRTEDDQLILTVRAIARDELGSQSAQPVMAGAYGVRPRVRAR